MDNRNAPIALSKEEFRDNGYRLIDTLADLLEKIPSMPVTSGESPLQLQELLGNASLPQDGIPVEQILKSATELLIHHSLYNGHPRFFGYITSSPAPLGALADLLAAVVNPNAGAQILSPIATEIEKQTVRWLAEFVGLSPTYGGVLVSGGNMANFTGFLAGRTAKAPKKIKQEGINGIENQLLVYCSKTTHTWIEKAMVLFGLGLQSLRWIEADEYNRINTTLLANAIEKDIAAGMKPIMVIGTAGDVSTGAVDDLNSIGTICKKYDCWFHIDGAYGIPAATIPDLKEMFAGIEDADSLALDPHKWLYSPLEAGCILVKDPNHLVETFSSHPVYYNFETSGEGKPQNFYEYGMQNSRGFRALKVWMMLQQVGRNGYIKMISDDIRLSKLMFDLATKHPELEGMSQNLSITTLRYKPEGEENASYLDALNEKLLNTLQSGGEVFLSNALVKNCYCLRACIVNFRTREEDIHKTIEIIAREGRKINTQLKNEK